MIQYGVAALEKATILLVCALSWIIWASSEFINITLTEYRGRGLILDTLGHGPSGCSQPRL